MNKKAYYCVYDKERICDESCGAYMESTEIRNAELVWDTCLNEYVYKYNSVNEGPMCRRMKYPIGEGKLIKKDGKVIEDEDGN